MPTRRLLVVNADDLGFAPGVNQGIIEAHDAGTLTSASMMVTTPAFEAAVTLVRTRAPKLGVGLHFDLLAGAPRVATPTLVDARTGRFRSLLELTARALAGRIDPDDVRRECDAQLLALARAGIPPTHLDSHRHAHALPGILPAVLASARAARVPVVRRPLDRFVISNPKASTKMAILHAAWRAALSGTAPEDDALLARSPRFRGIVLQGVKDVERKLIELLDTLEPGVTELMLHPGYDDEALAAQDPYRRERERELAALCSPAVRERLTRGDIRLVNFRELQRRRVDG